METVVTISVYGDKAQYSMRGSVNTSCHVAKEYELGVDACARYAGQIKEAVEKALLAYDTDLGLPE